MTWTFHDGEMIEHAWGLTPSIDGPVVTADGVEWNSSLGPDMVAEAGFIATHDGSPDTPPSELTINGAPCD